MISLMLMLAVPSAPETTPIDAERAFAADAKLIGQWTAFGTWAADDATIVWIADGSQPATIAIADEIAASSR